MTPPLAAGLAIGVVWADRRAVVSAGAPLVASANRQPCRRSPHRVVDGGMTLMVELNIYAGADDECRQLSGVLPHPTGLDPE